MNTPDKIEIYLREVIPTIYEYEFNGELYLCGGAVKGIILGIPVKDLDFIILSSIKGNNADIKAYALKNNYITRNNSFGDIKITHGLSLNVDMWHVSNLKEAMESSLDGLFYNVCKKELVSIGFEKTLKCGKDYMLDTDSNEERRVRRYKKTVRYIKNPVYRFRLLKYIKHSVVIEYEA